MRKALVFSGFFGILLIESAGFALPVDGAQYPTWAEETQTIGSTDYVVKDSAIKVATTRYMDTKLGDANTNVQTLNSNANTTKAIVDANSDDLDAMGVSRQVKPSTDECDTEGAPTGYEYVACGYITENGANAASNTDTNYTWVKIIDPQGN